MSPLTPAAALASPIGDFRDWHLCVTCRRCRVIRELFLNGLVEQYDAVVSLGAIVERLRCHRCRQPPYGVELANAARHDRGAINLRAVQ